MPEYVCSSYAATMLLYLRLLTVCVCMAKASSTEELRWHYAASAHEPSAQLIPMDQVPAVWHKHNHNSHDVHSRERLRVSGISAAYGSASSTTTAGGAVAWASAWVAALVAASTYAVSGAGSSASASSSFSSAACWTTAKCRFFGGDWIERTLEGDW